MPSGSTSYPASNDTFVVPSNPESTALSSAGDGTRNLTESVADLGAAVMALEALVAAKTHDHSGGSDGTSLLSQAHTHANVDTDISDSSIHHTIGPGQFQVARGNHVHNYAQLLNRPYEIVTSLTRPASPFPGLMIFETDSNFLQMWADTGSGYGWRIIPFLQIPQVEVKQATPQALPNNPGWAQLLWDYVVNDTANFINTGVDLAQLVVENAGTYVTNLAVQFAPDIAPNVAQVALFVNGALSSIQSNVFQRGESLVPGFSQTVSAQGPIRLDSGDVVTAAVSYVASQALDVVHTFVDDTTNLASRLSLAFLGH